MSRLEDLQPNASVRGILPDRLVTVVNVQWFGSEAMELTYKDSFGRVANVLLYRHDELNLEVVEVGRPWSFDGDGHLFRLVSEAQRIRLAYLFDPVLAVHTSLIDPLPHQITGVYEAMLPRQPLRFLLADDPGAGKTIMAGLLIKELIVRGDLHRCLIVCPGSLAEQWQDELFRRFQLPFEIQEVRGRRTGWIEKTRAAVKDRLTKEIGYWDHRAEELKLQEQAGRVNARLNSQEARRRADDLQARLQQRMEELTQESQISALPPVVIGGMVVAPIGLLNQIPGRPLPGPTAPADTQASATRARAIVMAIERSLGFEPTDRESEKLGYDIESSVPGTGKLRFIEVKGRISGAATLTVTKNEILYSLNKPADFILAIVEFMGDDHRVHYLRQPFQREPDFGVTSVNYNFEELLARTEAPT